MVTTVELNFLTSVTYLMVISKPYLTVILEYINVITIIIHASPEY